ncbi:unnamed protein product [Closterium sp. Naga37s-1]|nr:unnamed protein product [Closterium sp. Naga37s-1]
MRLRTPRFAFGLFLVLYASIAEGLRVLDDAAAKLTGPQTLTGIVVNPGSTRNAIHVGNYEGHVEARLRGVEDISGVIRVFVFRNTTSVNIRYSLRLTGLSVQGFPTAAGIVTARSNAPSYYGTIVAPGGRASGVFAVQPLALKVSHGGASTS